MKNNNEFILAKEIYNEKNSYPFLAHKIMISLMFKRLDKNSRFEKILNLFRLINDKRCDFDFPSHNFPKLYISVKMSFDFDFYHKNYEFNKEKYFVCLILNIYLYFVKNYNENIFHNLNFLLKNFTLTLQQKEFFIENLSKNHFTTISSMRFYTEFFIKPEGEILKIILE